MALGIVLWCLSPRGCSECVGCGEGKGKPDFAQSHPWELGPPSASVTLRGDFSSLAMPSSPCRCRRSRHRLCFHTPIFLLFFLFFFFSFGKQAPVEGNAEQQQHFGCSLCLVLVWVGGKHPAASVRAPAVTRVTLLIVSSAEFWGPKLPRQAGAGNGQSPGGMLSLQQGTKRLASVHLELRGRMRLLQDGSCCWSELHAKISS